jgi:hypothetical protein
VKPLVVITALEKVNPAIAHPINQAMLLRNPSRPATHQQAFERFGFTNPDERVS